MARLACVVSAVSWVHISYADIFGSHACGDSASLEALMSRYGADKARSKHKYTDAYGMLFDHFKDEIETFLEVGVAGGNSLKAWQAYFPRSTIVGVDIFYRAAELQELQQELKPFSRVNLLKMNSQSNITAGKSYLRPNNIDILIDDGDHDLHGQERTLETLWRFVRPGGYYIIEDVEWDRSTTSNRGDYPFLHRPDLLQPWTKEVLRNNFAIFLDTSIGHSSWDEYLRWSTKHWAIDRFKHNSNMIVIRKARRSLQADHVLERIMSSTGSHRSRQHHKYVDMYAMLFDPIFGKVRRFVEVGTGAGASLMSWHTFFPRAEIHGLIFSKSAIKEQLGQLPEPYGRIHRQMLLNKSGQPDAYGFAVESVDVLVDGSDHTFAVMESNLHALWAYVRPGGYYVIENVGWELGGDRRVYPALHTPEALHPHTQRIFKKSEVFFADASLGHPLPEPWRRRNNSVRGTSQYSHNSHVIVLRKIPSTTCRTPES